MTNNKKRYVTQDYYEDPLTARYSFDKFMDAITEEEQRVKKVITKSPNKKSNPNEKIFLITKGKK